MSPAKRAGFSIFELLVILAIIALLLGFLVPAVMKVREAAERTQRSNNLKQVSLATHAYLDVYRVLPPATFPAGMFAMGGPKDATLSLHLLPYVEQLPLAQVCLNNNKAPTDVTIPVYTALKDPSTMDHVRVQNFAGNVRVFTDGGLNTPYNKTVELKNPMPCGTSFLHFTDGNSNTIMYATRYASSRVISEKGQSTSPCGYYDLPLTNNGGSFFGAAPMTAKASATSAAGWQIMPTLAQVNCDAAVGLAHSMDQSGLLVSLCDGSTRWIYPTMSPQTWNFALQPNDGNPLPADW